MLLFFWLSVGFTESWFLAPDWFRMWLVFCGPIRVHRVVSVPSWGAKADRWRQRWILDSGQSLVSASAEIKHCSFPRGTATDVNTAGTAALDNTCAFTCSLCASEKHHLYSALLSSGDLKIKTHLEHPRVNLAKPI